MNDEKLINAVAELWIVNGGDADGFLWCVNKIHMAILDKQKEKENDDTCSNRV